MTKADIYKAVSDLINDNYNWLEDNKDVSLQWVLGINDMARYIVDKYDDKPVLAPEPPKEEKKSTRKIELDMGKVKALRDAGWTLKEIADEMHVVSSTISNKLKEEGEEE